MSERNLEFLVPTIHKVGYERAHHGLYEIQKTRQDQIAYRC